MPTYVPEFQLALEEVVKIDPTLQKVVDEHEFPAFVSPKPQNESSFEYLVRNILSQQVSGAAGNAILAKFLILTESTPADFPSPSKLLDYSVEQLRSAGLSQRKAEYVRGLAEAYLAGQLTDSMFSTMDDDEIVDSIVAIRGLGPWTAQMFLIFYLHRMNVFSTGDIGVQRGMRRYIKDRPELIKQIKDHAVPNSPGKSKKARVKTSLPPDLVNMEQIAAHFAPYRTAFQLILWKMSDIQMETVEARNAADKRTVAEKRSAANRKEEARKPPVKRRNVDV